MVDQSQINLLYESSRQELVNSDSLIKEITSINHPQLKERLLEITRTIQADLLILVDYLFELSNCVTDDDIEALLELHDIEELRNEC